METIVDPCILVTGYDFARNSYTNLAHSTSKTILF